MTGFLTPPPSELEEKPPAERLTDWHQFAGRTIRTVIECPAGKRGGGVDAVIVFDDDCWATLEAEGDADELSITLGNHFGFHGGRPVPTLTDYLSPSELHDAGLVNTGQYEHLLAQQAREKEEEKAREVARLRARADQLEGKKPA